MESPSHSSSKNPVRTREIVAWALCDWANSAYSTLLITILVSYLQGFVLKGSAGILAYGWGLGVSMFLAACLSPVVGAMADARANKRTWLLATSYVGATCGVLMGIVQHHWSLGPWLFSIHDGARWLSFFVPHWNIGAWLFVGLFFIATLSFELSFSFYNGFLPEIADETSMNRLSGYGYAAGYFGGGVALAAAIGVLTIGSAYGLSTETGLRAGLVLMGLWWAVFMLPAALLLYDRSQPRPAAPGIAATARQALGEVFQTLSRVRSYSVLALFLLGFLLYNEGIQTVMNQASVFAREVLRMQPGELGLVVLMIQFVATPAAIGVGQVADRLGPKPTLLACLGIWCGILIVAYFVTERWQFWCLGAVLSLVMGGTQSVSRAIMGSMTPVAKTAEFFGFFNLSARATSMVGPILFAQMLVLTGSANVAILSLLVFILAGVVVVAYVDLPRGITQAKAG